MNSDPKTVVQCFYDALNRGDVPALQTLFADKISWTEAEGFPYYSGTWTTFGEVIEKLVIPLNRDWDGFSAKSHHMIAEGGEAVSLGAYSGTNKKTGKPLAAPFAHHWTVSAGKITSFGMYTDTAKVLEAMR
jgi:ketosteroid isomerase-like protein